MVQDDLFFSLESLCLKLFSLSFPSPMNRTKKLVASISTLLTRRTYSSNTRCNPLAAIAINSQAHFIRDSLKSSSAKPLAISVNWLRFSGRAFCSESCDKRSSVCWNCGSSPAFLFCESCRSIQPVDDSVDYFQIFGLENKYELDAGSLEGKYKDWQKKLHPDLVHNKSKVSVCKIFFYNSAYFFFFSTFSYSYLSLFVFVNCEQKERDYAAEQSAKVTEALRTLTKRLSRAMYIMKLNGIHINEEETLTDPELLMEIMELREAIAEASDSNALNQIRSQVQKKLEQSSGSFLEAFESQRFDEAVKCIQRMTYYERACEEIVKKL